MRHQWSSNCKSQNVTHYPLFFWGGKLGNRNTITFIKSHEMAILGDPKLSEKASVANKHLANWGRWSCESRLRSENLRVQITDLSYEHRQIASVSHVRVQSRAWSDHWQKIIKKKTMCSVHHWGVCDTAFQEVQYLNPYGMTCRDKTNQCIKYIYIHYLLFIYLFIMFFHSSDRNIYPPNIWRRERRDFP